MPEVRQAEPMRGPNALLLWKSIGLKASQIYKQFHTNSTKQMSGDQTLQHSQKDTIVHSSDEVGLAAIGGGQCGGHCVSPGFRPALRQ